MRYLSCLKVFSICPFDIPTKYLHGTPSLMYFSAQLPSDMIPYQLQIPYGSQKTPLSVRRNPYNPTIQLSVTTLKSLHHPFNELIYQTNH